MGQPSTPNRQSLLLLIAFVVIASLDSVYKYTGAAGMAVYVVAAFALLYFYFERVFPILVEKVSLWNSVVIAAAAAIGLAILTLWLYDLANSGRIGPGGDGDDALILAATELLGGRYPFYPLTYLGNPIAPMPGSVLLSVPFVLFGVYPLQNLFWLIVFFAVAGFWMNSFRRALFLALPVLGASPSIFQNLAAGNDHVSNSVYVLLFALLSVRAAWKATPRWWEFLLPSVLLGVALSSRTNFAFVMPLLIVLLARKKGYGVALSCTAAVALTFIAVTLPFYMYDPSGFTPLLVQTGKMQQFNVILPHAGLILGVVSLVLSTGLALVSGSERAERLFRNLAFVQLTILIFTSTLFSIWTGQFNLYFGHIGYGLFTMFFGVFSQLRSLSSDPPGVDYRDELG